MRNHKHFLLIISALAYIALVMALAMPLLNKSHEQKALAVDCGLACGNGELDEGCGEQCDDSGTANCDGCNQYCQIELDTDEDGLSDACDNCPLIPNNIGTIDTLLDSLNGTYTNITALVPNMYTFAYDGGMNSISDGNNDMYDGGNFLNTNLASGINYTSGVITAGDSAFGAGSEYFTAQLSGVFVLAVTGASIDYFEISGNNGADGSGNYDGTVLSASSDGNQYSVYVKRVYNAGDPSINHIIVVPGDGSGVSYDFATNTDNDWHRINGLSGIPDFYYLLVSSIGGGYVGDSDIANIVDEFLTNLVGQADMDGDGIGDACDSPECGNSFIEEGENCDDGNAVSDPENGDFCDETCNILLGYCGNGILEEGEQCEDGNIVDGDGCSSECLYEPVGCLFGWPGMFLRIEPGTEDTRCSDWCSLIGGYTMGGFANTIYDFCFCADGTTVQCSDSCDFLNDKPQSADQYCGYTECGNGIIDSGEQCDDRNQDNGDGCTSYCRIEYECGNGIVESGNDEQCDDGGTVDGDGCDSDCQIEGTSYEHAAGDPIEDCDSIDPTVCLWRNVDMWGNPGYVNNTVGNDDPFDSYFDTGALKWYAGSCYEGNSTAYSFLQQLIESAPIALVEPLNKFLALFIDDAYAASPRYNLIGKYTCLYVLSSDTYYDVYWTGYSYDDDSFSYVRREFTPVCGDGKKSQGEQCDDGNPVSGDGCSSTCKFEGTEYTHEAGDLINTCDSIDPTVCLWRSPEKGSVNNTIGNDDPFEPTYDTGALEWYTGNCDGGSMVPYPLFEDLLGSAPIAMAEPLNKFIAMFVGDAYARRLYDPVGRYICLHIFSEDQYYNVYWTGYSNDDDSFSYIRREYTPVCGNNIKEVSEECDDGNITNGDGCSSECEIEGYRFIYDGGGVIENEPSLGDEIIESEVNIWRDPTGAVFNTYNGTNYDDATGNSTIGWACGKCADVETDYTAGIASLTKSHSGKCIPGGMRNIPGYDTCLYLPDSNLYYDIFWLSWESGPNGEGGDGGFSYVRNLYDAQPPDAPSMLMLMRIDPSFFALRWRAPYDNGGGYVQRFETRYSTDPITDEESWDSAAIFYNSIIPISGNPQTLPFYSTLPDDTYYFAIRAVDDSGNISAIGSFPPIVIVTTTEPSITSVSPLSGVNDTGFTLTVNGENFAAGTQNTVYLSGDSGALFNTRSLDTSTTTRLDVTIPSGLIPDDYSVIVSANAGPGVGGYSDAFTDKITITQAETPLPVVTDVIPSMVIAGSSIQIIGENFTGATAASLKMELGSTPLENVNPVSDTLVTADVPVGISGTYWVIVQTPAGENAISVQKLTVTDALVYIDENTTLTTSLNQGSIADFSGFDDQLSTTLPAAVSFNNTSRTIIGGTTWINNLSYNIPAGTTLTDGAGDKYLGQLYPPRLVTKGEALNPDVYGQLADGALVFEIGNPDNPVYFDEDIIVSFQIVSDTAPGLVWYYNTETGKFEPAGKTGTKDGIDFIPGGALMSHVGDTYTIGILTNHLSPYVIGVTPTITNISPSSGASGTAITITGTNFHPNADVTIGGMSATATVDDTETISAIVPGLGAGSQPVVVTNPDMLSATSSFTVTTAGGGTGGETYTPTSGGGMPMSFITPLPESDTKTSSTPSILRETATEDKIISRPLEINGDMLTTKGDTVSALLTGANATITIKPNRDSSLSLVIPANTTISASSVWDAIINPPLIRSIKDNISRTGDTIKGVIAKLYRGDVTVVIEAGSPDVPLYFNNPVTIEVSVSFPNGTLVDIFRRPAGDGTWEFINTKTVENGKVRFETTHLSLFAVARADATRKAAVVKEVTVKPAAPNIAEFVAEILSVFKDVKNHWASTYINRLYMEDIISGKTATTFAPNDPITRAEVIKIALKAFIIPIPSRVSEKPFPDVEVTAWYAPYAAAAKKYGILKGFPEGMRPNELVSRAEALKILLTASKLPLQVTSTKNFTDTSPGAWYMYYVRYAYENGIIAGYADGTFRPASTITRAEIAKMTVKIMDLVLGK
jgi:cysteine-rich repeat protein